MNNIYKRYLLFLFGCLGSRTLLVYFAKNAKEDILKYLGYITLIIGIAFMYFFITGKRKTGPEVFGDKIWWNKLRPIHSILYLLFSYNAIIGNNTWYYLLIDLLLGLFSFLYYHFC